MKKYHRTAISRNTYSSPVKYLIANNLINKDDSILDFGCGRGDDVENLDADGYDVLGYDLNGPYSSDWTVLNRRYDFIMCNFVLNVIENIKERDIVVKDIISLLDEGGTAYITVRNDKEAINGITSLGTYQGFVEPTTIGWELIYKNTKRMMWKYKKERAELTEREEREERAERKERAERAERKEREEREERAELAVTIYEDLRHYKPSNSIWDRWNYKPADHGRRKNITHYEHAIALIIELLEQGYKVKRGWCGSSMVKTFKEFYLFYKK